MASSESVRMWMDRLFRVGLGGLFIYASWFKIEDPALFADAVSSYQLLPQALVGLFSLVMPMLELVVGVSLIFSKWPRESAFVMLGMLLMFLVALVQAKVRGLEISCGCFTDSSSDEKEDLMKVIVRDVVLLAPTVWLVLRPNGWLWRWCRAGAAVLALLLMAPCAIWADDAQAPTNAVVPGVWTDDFSAVMAQARQDHRPVVMVVGKKKCSFCMRLSHELEERPFKKWVEATGVYLLKARLDKTNSVPAQAQTARFAFESPHKKALDIPCVGIYWPKSSNEEVRVAFTGRRGRMIGQRHPLLIAELMNAFDETLDDYLKTLEKRPVRDELLAKKVKVVSEGGGRVAMSPPNGKLYYGKVVQLSAFEEGDLEFVEWRAPDNRRIRKGSVIMGTGEYRYKVQYDKPVGTYTAIFRKKPPAD